MKLAFTLLLLLSIYTIITSATKELTVGPYEVTADETAAYKKSNITQTQTGVPLKYLITVTQGGAIVSGVRLDTWTANAQGLYSGEADEGTTGTDYLRGWQVTDSKGQVTFASIYPGSYSGRTNHAHIRVRIYASDGVTTTFDDTTQLFFPSATNAAVMALAAYKRTTDVTTTNANDNLYVLENEVVLTGNTTAGFVATYTIALPMGTSTPSTTASKSTTNSTVASSIKNSTSTTTKPTAPTSNITAPGNSTAKPSTSAAPTSGAPASGAPSSTSKPSASGAPASGAPASGAPSSNTTASANSTTKSSTPVAPTSGAPASGPSASNSGAPSSSGAPAVGASASSAAVTGSSASKTSAPTTGSTNSGTPNSGANTTVPSTSFRTAAAGPSH